MRMLEYILIALFTFLFYLFIFPHLKVAFQEVNNPLILKCVRFWTGDWERTVSYDEWDFPNFSPVIQGGFVVSNFNN